jgi:hypothetical protein
MKAEEIMMRKLNAFELYKRESKLNTVKKRYPDLVSFVEMNKHKTLDQLREELLKELYINA